MGRKLVVTQNVTLDGAVEMLDDWFDPAGHADVDQSDLVAQMHRHHALCDAVLLGRQTFEAFRGYWPDVAPDNDPAGVSPFLDQVHKYVVSTTLAEPGWQHTTILSGDVVQEVGRLTMQPGDDIVATGSIQLCHTLLAAGLVDEVRMFTFPAIQGRGRRFFPENLPAPKASLLEAQTFVSGVTYSAYALKTAA